MMMTPRPVKSRARSRAKAVREEDWNARLLRYAALLALYAVFLVFVLSSWINLFGTSIAPFWALAPIFIWSIRRAELMPGGLLLIVGLLSDIVIGTPLGVHALAILAVATLARLQQRYLMTQNFVAIWADFAALSFLFSAIVTIMTLLSRRTFDALGNTLIVSLQSWAVLLLLFPIMALAAHALVNLVQKSET